MLGEPERRSGHCGKGRIPDQSQKSNHDFSVIKPVQQLREVYIIRLTVLFFISGRLMFTSFCTSLRETVFKQGQTRLCLYNKMQQDAVIYLLQNHSLHVSGVHRTHHQEYNKL